MRVSEFFSPFGFLIPKIQESMSEGIGNGCFGGQSFCLPHFLSTQLSLSKHLVYYFLLLSLENSPSLTWGKFFISPFLCLAKSNTLDEVGEMKTQEGR